MLCVERADGYSLLPLVVVTLLWVLFEELLRRLLSLPLWAAIPTGLVAALLFLWMFGATENHFRHLLRANRHED